MTKFEICADGNGSSHWGSSVAKFDAVDYAPPLPPVVVSEKVGATGYVLIRVPRDLDKVPHPTPKRQLCVVLSGAIEVTTSDDE